MIVSVIAWFVFCSFSVMLRVPPLQESSSFEPLQSADSLTVELANVSFSASPSNAYVNEEVTFFANASSDVPAASLTFRIYFDGFIPPFSNNTASATSVSTTGNPGSVIFKYTYDAPGNFSDENGPFYFVRLFVGDGTNTVEYPYIKVYMNYNSPPSFVGYVEDPLVDVWKNITKSLSTIIQDVNNDPVTVTWDFGDGTANETQLLTGTAAADGVYSNVTHAWSPPADPGVGDFTVIYQMNITLDDGFNPPVVSTSFVNVYVPINFPPTIGFAASVSRASPGDVINFSARATDAEGDPLTWTFNYSDGSIEVFHTLATSPGTLVWNNVTHHFDAIGSYTVSIYVSDALEPNQVSYHNQSADVEIQIVDNLPPEVSKEISSSPQGDPQIQGMIGNISVEFSIEGNDWEGDVVTAVWDMNDTLGPRTNATSGGTDKFMFNQTRVFDKPVCTTYR